MKATYHRDGSVSVQLTPDECAHFFCVIREGRRAMSQEYASYSSSDDDIALMRVLDRAASAKPESAAIIAGHVERAPA